MTLKQFFTEHPKAALAFSGGVDSAYLLYAAKAEGCDVRPYFVKSPFQPQFELDDARRLAGQLGVELTVLPCDILSHPEVAENTAERCYHCKRQIMRRIIEAARADGYALLLDGTNASDDASDRPGTRALKELEVRSPLRDCGITKAEVRSLSRDAGLFTWDKPAYACLATRVPTGSAITADMLRRVEAAEAAVHALGFSDFRVRALGGIAKLQLPAEQMARAVELQTELVAAVAPYFVDVLLDLRAR